ncbi:MAG: WD40 repeat domain-containing protein, partial [Planctomycetes bacterium]|nr:WD40 repeat domain-containing protein [Planctomycetota bacterium]
IRVWDLDRLPGVLEWRTDAGTERTAVALAPDGGTLAWAGGQGGTIHVLRPGQGSAPLCIDGHGAVVEALGFTADGLRLASADRDGTVVLRDAATGRPLRSWRTGRTFARGLAWAPDGERLAVGGFDGRIAILRADRDEPEREWQAHAGPVFTLAFAPDGSLASGGADWRARVWRPGAVRPSAEWRHGEWVAAVAFTPDGGLLATGSADLLIRLGSPDGAPRVPMRQSHGHWVTCLDFLDGGRVLVSGGNDEALRFWDCPSGEELASLSLHLGPVQSLAVARDGRKLLVGCPEVVRLLDLGAAFDRIAGARQAAR